MRAITTTILLVLTLVTTNYANWLAFIQGIAVAVLAVSLIDEYLK
jgi:hypothetical protein